MATNVLRKLHTVQIALRAPKDCRNNFGGYNYRKAEDILEAVKPLLARVGAVIKLDDEIVMIGNRYYLKAVASFIDAEEEGGIVQSTAFAREAEQKKGMDEAQVTGSSSSYARKYALNGLLAIDDSSQDPDVTNKHGKDEGTATAQGGVRQAPALTQSQILGNAAGQVNANAPAKAPAKKAVSEKGKQAWKMFRELERAKKMSDAQRSESFKNLLKEQTGNVDTVSISDDEWDNVINHIDILAAM